MAKMYQNIEKLITYSYLHIHTSLTGHNQCLFAQFMLLRRGCSLQKVRRAALGRAQKHRKSMDLMEWIKIHEDIRPLSERATTRRRRELRRNKTDLASLNGTSVGASSSLFYCAVRIISFTFPMSQWGTTRRAGSSSHLRTMLPKSCSQPLLAHAT